MLPLRLSHGHSYFREGSHRSKRARRTLSSIKLAPAPLGLRDLPVNFCDILTSIEKIVTLGFGRCAHKEVARSLDLGQVDLARSCFLYH